MSRDLNPFTRTRLKRMKAVGEAYGWLITATICAAVVYGTYQSWLVPYKDGYYRSNMERYHKENAIRATFIVDLKVGMAATCRTKFDDPKQILFARNWTKSVGRSRSIIRENALPQISQLTKDEQELLALTFDAESLMQQASVDYADNIESDDSERYLDNFKLYHKNYRGIMRRTLGIMTTTYQFVDISRQAWQDQLLNPSPNYDLNANLTPDFCPEEAALFDLRPIGAITSGR